MRLLLQLLDRINISFKDDVNTHVLQDRLQHLDVALDQLKKDSPVLMKWIDDEMKRIEFLANKYRGEEGSQDYTDRLIQLEKIKAHISYFLSIN